MKETSEIRPRYGPIMGLLLKAYKSTLSVIFQAVGIHCRHHPTCSEYCAEACTRYGVWAGSWMGLARFCRCRPGGTQGEDPVPQDRRQTASWMTPWLYGQWGSQRFDTAENEEKTN